MAGIPCPGTRAAPRRPSPRSATSGMSIVPRSGASDPSTTVRYAPLDRVGAEERLKRPQRLARADHQDHARGVPVETVYDPDIRTRPAPRSRQIPSGPLEQRVGLARLGRLGEESGRLIDDQDVPVLVEHLDLPGRRLGPGPIGIVGEYAVGLDVLRGIDASLARQVDLTSPHCLAPAAPREAEPLRHQLVQPHHESPVGEGRSVRRVGETHRREPDNGGLHPPYTKSLGDSSRQAAIADEEATGPANRPRRRIPQAEQWRFLQNARNHCSAAGIRPIP